MRLRRVPKLFEGPSICHGITCLDDGTLFSSATLNETNPVTRILLWPDAPILSCFDLTRMPRLIPTDATGQSSHFTYDYLKRRRPCPFPFPTHCDRMNGENTCHFYCPAPESSLKRRASQNRDRDVSTPPSWN